jgi:hypothetical protein
MIRENVFLSGKQISDKNLQRERRRPHLFHGHGSLTVGLGFLFADFLMAIQGPPVKIGRKIRNLKKF